MSEELTDREILNNILQGDWEEKLGITTDAGKRLVGAFKNALAEHADFVGIASYTLKDSLTLLAEISGIRSAIEKAIRDEKTKQSIAESSKRRAARLREIREKKS